MHVLLKYDQGSIGNKASWSKQVLYRLC